VAGAAQAGAETEKIKKLHDRGKLERATSLCAQLEASASSEFVFARDTCAQVALDVLSLDNPSGLSQDQLDAHADRWEGTPAGDTSHEQAARIALAAAGQSLEKLNQVTWTYQRTQAATEAQTRIWQIAFDRARLLASPEAYAEFRQKYPGAPQRREARELEQEAAFDRAMAEGTSEAMRVFVAAYPESPEVDRAKKLEMDYAFHEAGKTGTSEAWHTLYKQFVAHPRRHEIQARWYATTLAEVETRGVAPLLLYSAVHPSDAAAHTALEAAVVTSVSARMIGGHPDHPGWDLPREGEAAVPRVSQLSAVVEVRFPYVSNHSPEVHVFAEKGAVRKSIQQHLQDLFKLDRDQAAEMAIQWRSPEEGLWRGRLPLGLCQPRGVRFIVEVKLMGETIRFSFRSDTPCADWWVPMVVWNGSARRGGAKSIGAWSQAAGELPPLPPRDAWWTGHRFEHTPPRGAGTVVTWPDGTRYWRPGSAGRDGRAIEDLLILPSFAAPGFELGPQSGVNVLRLPGGDRVEVAAGLDLQHHVWLAATKPPGQGRASGELPARLTWVRDEASGAAANVPPEEGSLLELRFPTTEIRTAWTQQLETLLDEPATLRWSAMVDLDLDDQLEGVVCLATEDPDPCYIADWREGGPAWFVIYGFAWPASVKRAPFAFWTDSGVYLARVDPDGASTARYTGTAYLGARRGL